MNNNMPTIEANMGEHVYDFLQRAIKEVNAGKWNGMRAKHNDIKVLVYQGSLLGDICDKYDMQVVIIRLQQELLQNIA